MSRIASFVIIEQFLRAKRADAAGCEDVMVITDHFAAIIDGATSKSAQAAERHTPGRLLAQALANAVRECEPAVTARAAIDHLTAAAKRLNDQRLQSNEELASASVIILSFARREVWRVGDCLLRIGGTEYPPKNDLERRALARRLRISKLETLAASSCCRF